FEPSHPSPGDRPRRPSRLPESRGTALLARRSRDPFSAERRLKCCWASAWPGFRARKKLTFKYMDSIGRYRIIGELGRGAMGVVYPATDPWIGRSVAIKTIRIRDINDTAQRDRLRERLFREARSAGVLSHPNIVTIYDMDEVDGLAYIAMAYVNGP